MDCLAFRRRLLEDPMDGQPELFEHEEACPECAKFARETRAQEIRLRALLRDVAAPPELADRIQLAAHFQNSRSPQQRIWYATAASILLMIVVSTISLFNTSWERSNMALAQSVIAHIEEEETHLHETGLASTARIKMVLGRFGAQLTGSLGRVNFAAECLMRKKTGVHLVLNGQNGPITVFFMPNEQLEQPSILTSPRFQGELLPTQWGSIAVVGEQGENLSGIAERMDQAVDWPTRTAQASGSNSGLVEVSALSIPLVTQQQDG